jgi:NADH:ubiquinone oxidoreductase subunit F (NADH-binding)
VDDLITRVAAATVVGAGGAAFPTDRKLESLSGSRVSHVIVNGAEGETASGKDGVLLGHVPHLVLDGAVTAALALGAPRIVVRISADRPDLAVSLRIALAERRDAVPIELSIGPATFVAGEATAVIRAITGGPARPADLGRPPSIRSGVARRRSHVMLSNAETFARMALAARGGADRSALASASGAVRDPGVVELPESSTLADLAAAAGGLVGSPGVLITGGWHGRWVPWDGLTAETELTRDALSELGGRWGAGAFVWIPEDLPTWDALAGVARELAEGTAGQCGPCWRGLPALADVIASATDARSHRVEIEGLMAQVDGRGICAHPSAAVAALRSALDLIGEDR